MDRAPRDRLRLVSDSTPTGTATAVADAPPSHDVPGPGPTPDQAERASTPETGRRSPITVAKGWLRAALPFVRPVWNAIRDFWLVGVVVVLGLAAVAAAIWLLVKVITALSAALTAAGNGVGHLLDWITDGPISRSISDPVTAYLTAHSQGLPATGHQLWLAWLVVAAVLYLCALLASPYARAGWAAVGVLTVLAAYTGAPTGAGPGAATATAMVWLLLSAPAYARTPRISEPNHGRKPRDTDSSATPTVAPEED